ncbi:MAG: UDP-N-acetylmuramoyl-L-alanine--D-glutamate ligase [Phycisphaerae bacterium]
MIDNWKGIRVTVMGLGRFGGGLGAVRWLVEQGACVTVSDRDPKEKLANSIAALRDLDVALHVGAHHEADFVDTDLVVVNPAVPFNSPFPEIAVHAGVPVTTELNLFLERNPAPVIGVTGSVGKSTTVAMIESILVAELGRARVWVGGNFGDSLLASLSQIKADHRVILELSSFQLYRTAALRWSPEIAVITNILPNHLDWHGSFAHYTAAKFNILRFQDPGADQIVIGDHPALRETCRFMFGDLAGIWRYSVTDRGPGAVMQATSNVDTDNRAIAWPQLRLPIPGRHNLENAAAALTVAHAISINQETALAALASFTGLPHRIKHVRDIDGVAFVNDSKASSPDAAKTAMQSFEGPLLMIVGGYDKGLDLQDFGKQIAARAKFAACIGQTGQQLQGHIQNAHGAAESFQDFASAVRACAARAVAGDTVLLSPGSASWGMFADFRERGAQFEQIVQALAGNRAECRT